MQTLLTAAEAAEQLGVGRRRVLKLLERGQLKGRRAGISRTSEWAIDQVDLDAFKQQQRPRGRPPKVETRVG